VSEIAERFPSIRALLVTRGEIGEGLSEGGRHHVKKTLARMGIALREGVSVTALEARRLRVEGGPDIDCDACVWAASFGVSPLARDAGFAVSPRGQVLVDATMRSVSHPEVFAVGDAAIPAESVGVPIRMGCATAMPMAACGADNLADSVQGRAPTGFRYAYLAQFVSLGRRECLAQLVHHDDSPRDLFLTGILASSLKELTFRMNLFGIRTGFYPWRLLLLAAPRLASKASSGPSQIAR